MEVTEGQSGRYRRDRNSSWWVRVSDRVAKQIITIGGIGTILVVMLVVLVLLGNVLPMFQRNEVESLPVISFASQSKSGLSGDATLPVACGVDEFSELVWTIHRGDYLSIHSIANGELVSEHFPEPGGQDTPAKTVTACTLADNDTSMLIGYSDGTVRPITLTIEVSFVKQSELNESIASSLKSGIVIVDGTVYRVMPSGVVRKQTVQQVAFHKPIEFSSNAVTRVDWRNPQVASSFDDSQTWTWGATDGKRLALGTVENKVNGFSSEVTQETKTWTASLDAQSNESILGLMIGSRADHIHSLDSSGRVLQWSPTDNGKLKESLSHKSMAGSESKAVVSTPLLGRETLVVGSESGYLESIALTSTASGSELLSIHQFAGDLGSVQNLVSSPEGRLVAAKFASGKNAIYYVPTNRQLIQWPSPDGQPKDEKSQLFFSASAETIGLLSGNKVNLWKVRIPFPEASLSSFFGRIWYEGYESPQYVWQSSTGNVEGEYKFGFMPLIFGTLKATFYSMLIGAPIALMAAIFGSEFMNSRWRARVKPFIELMASVPSVVLGFIGALVMAPILRDNLMFVLLSVVSVLFMFVFAAHLWLIVPGPVAIRFRSLRLPIMFLLIPAAILIAYVSASTVEGMLFEGNLVQWLSNHDGTGWSGWFCLALLPVSLMIAWLVAGPISPLVQSYARATQPFQFSLINLAIFFVSVATILVVSAIAASTLTGVGMDPRGSVLGPYQERNALLVGSILGFAIIPLIYTISEDALQSVPQHLRSASLGCGATTWQTTIRVVVPTAMSGLFSALMIGFGRAVGETMVVLMAAGNTPVMDINPLNGYRTLSATLATELPEAARGSTHFHALFLAAFLLFCFTMVANTIAELVRIRFRKRAFQL